MTPISSLQDSLGQIDRFTNLQSLNFANLFMKPYAILQIPSLQISPMESDGLPHLQFTSFYFGILQINKFLNVHGYQMRSCKFTYLQTFRFVICVSGLTNLQSCKLQTSELFTKLQITSFRAC